MEKSTLLFICTRKSINVWHLAVQKWYLKRHMPFTYEEISTFLFVDEKVLIFSN